jgi:hypothetical protein
MIGLLVWGSLLSYVSHIESTSPRKPILATGQIMPHSWKGVIVYVRASEADSLHKAYLAIFGFAILIGSIIFLSLLRKNGWSFRILILSSKEKILSRPPFR